MRVLVGLLGASLLLTACADGEGSPQGQSHSSEALGQHASCDTGPTLTPMYMQYSERVLG